MKLSFFSSAVPLALLLAFAAASSTHALADDPPPPAPETPAAPDAAATPTAEPSPEVIPDIEAKTYPLEVSQRSTSMKVYLFKDSTKAAPVEGKLLLIKKTTDDPIIAVRVLKSYPDTNQFAAKRVKSYGSNLYLDPGEHYTAIEKLNDVAAPIAQTAQDRADIRELEKSIVPNDPVLDAPPPTAAPAPTIDPNAAAAPPPAPEPAPLPTQLPTVQANDPELDAGTSPPPENTGDDNADDDHTGLEIEDTPVLDPKSNWLTGSLGYFLNNTPSGSSGNYYTGGGFRYGYTLGKELFLKRAAIQDSFVLEGGLFLYKILTTTNSDSYVVMPTVVTLRYNIQFGKSLGFFLDGGVLDNIVVAATNAQPGAVQNLSTFLPAVGVGLFFNVGPSWDLRADIGYDFIGLGLTLRF